MLHAPPRPHQGPDAAPGRVGGGGRPADRQPPPRPRLPPRRRRRILRPPEPGPAPRSPPPRPDRGRRADPPLRGPRRAVLRRLRHRAPPDALLDHPHGAVRRVQDPLVGRERPLPAPPQDRRRPPRRRHRRRRRQPRRRRHGPDAGRRPPPRRGAPQLPVRRRRDLAHGAGRGGRVPLARELADGEPRDDRHREPAVDVRPGEGEHTAEGGDGGRAGDARGCQPGGGAGGGGGVEPGGRGEDEGDEHEGGEGDAAAVRGGARLRDEDGEGGGADGPVQGVRPDRVEAGAVHRGAVRDARAGAEAAQGLLSAPELELGDRRWRWPERRW
ncbi:putative mitochondrial uncoupling protein 5 [Iris pallida]|uniref:Mitochondrial uncoupling protein 5 n=1 Tax=Iris pallida TaxID=29817 RepID=A0AAX6FI11_IRIPA|nr:putative mitochondrial uncoupling protein 5 [Iris pallida]